MSSNKNDDLPKKDLISFEAETKGTAQAKEEAVESDDDSDFYFNPIKDEYEILRQKLLPNEPENIKEDLKLLNLFNHQQLTFLLLNDGDIMKHLKLKHGDLHEALISGELSSDEMKMLFLSNLNRQKIFLKLLEDDSKSDDSDLNECINISERIRRWQLRNSLKEAYQYIPNSFTDPSMAHIKCIINRFEVIAMLDTGLGISRQVGRIHMMVIIIAGATLLSSVSISTESKDLIIGLNIIKTHKCEIDLDRNEFVIGSRGVSTPILSDEELPKHLKAVIEPHLLV